MCERRLWHLKGRFEITQFSPPYFTTFRSTVPVILKNPTLRDRLRANPAALPTSGTDGLSVSTQISATSDALMKTRSAGKSEAAGDSSISRAAANYTLVVMIASTRASRTTCDPSLSV